MGADLDPRRQTRILALNLGLDGDGEIAHGQTRGPGQDDHALDYIPEFPHIPWPGIGCEYFHGVGRDIFNLLVVPGIEFLEKVFKE